MKLCLSLNNGQILNQSKSPPPNPKSSSYSFGAYFFGAYFLGASFGAYVFLVSAFPAGLAGPEEAPPILARPSEISLLISFPFNDSINLLMSASDSVA
jgi:hypothetical protein